MSKTFVRYKKQRVSISLATFAIKKKVNDDDETVPFLQKRDLYRDKVHGTPTH